MGKLLDYYESKLKAEENFLVTTGNNGSINDEKRLERTRTKIDCYKTFIAELKREKAKEETSASGLHIACVINWVAIKDQLPPAGETVLLASKDQYKTEFIHEFDLTTQTYQRNWTHWAFIPKPPCL